MRMKETTNGIKKTRRDIAVLQNRARNRTWPGDQARRFGDENRGPCGSRRRSGATKSHGDCITEFRYRGRLGGPRPELRMRSRNILEAASIGARKSCGGRLDGGKLSYLGKEGAVDYGAEQTAGAPRRIRMKPGSTIGATPRHAAGATMMLAVAAAAGGQIQFGRN